MYMESRSCLASTEDRAADDHANRGHHSCPTMGQSISSDDDDDDDVHDDELLLLMAMMVRT
jgi:hypothetical protein